MNNKRLLEIIKDPGTASEKEIKDIKNLAGDYSYSPLLKVLQARLDNLHNHKNKSKSLTRAAIYIADRGVLKAFISNDKLGPVEAESLKTVKKEEPVKKEAEKIETTGVDLPKEPIKQKAEVSGKPEISQVQVSEKETGEVKDKKKPLTKEKVDKAGKEKEPISEKGEKEIEPPIVKEVVKKSKEVEEKSKEVEEKKILESEESKESSEVSKAPITRTVDEEVPELKDETAGSELEDEIATGKETQKPVAEKIEEDASQKEKRVADTKIEEKAGTEVEEKNSLSSEILKNISELKKHKASLFHFLEMDDKKKHKSEKEKSKKSVEKGKGKKKKKVKEEIEENNIEGQYIDEKKVMTEVSAPDEEVEDYPDYEEEDREVIENFLHDLEESTPPPKRKLKREEQEKLIEKFIQSDPQMQSVRSSKEIKDKQDLSLSSVKFRDDIISENLASIMVKQGKLEKAIDIYKKLIWKFPQKKAYFAAQIEALKKKSGK